MKYRKGQDVFTEQMYVDGSEENYNAAKEKWQIIGGQALITPAIMESKYLYMI